MCSQQRHFLDGANALELILPFVYCRFSDLEIGPAEGYACDARRKLLLAKRHEYGSLIDAAGNVSLKLIRLMAPLCQQCASTHPTVNTELPRRVFD
jgi:hypothetical protein